MTDNSNANGGVGVGGRPAPGDSKICGVCGDKALGYNFNAITCESCKAFFRRNALKIKEFKCPFNDSCKVDVVTRRFCQKCRLKRCVEIGMKKEWIMTDEEKKVKKQKIEENRQKRHTASEMIVLESTPDTSPASSSSSAHGSVCSPPASVDPVELVRDIAVVLVVKSSSSSSSSSPSPMAATSLVAAAAKQPMDVDVLTPTSEERSSSECDGSLESPVFRDLVSPLSSKAADDCSPSSDGMSASPCSMGGCGSGGDWRTSYHLPSPSSSTSTTTTSSVTSPYASPTPNQLLDPPLLIGCQQPALPLIQAPLSVVESSGRNSPPRCELTSDERAVIDELLVANKAMKSPIPDDERFLNAVDPSLINVINLTDIAIRRLIKMSKKIAGFRRLCQEDQIALLKGSCTELMILRSVMTYNPENDCWLGPRGPGRLGGEVMRIKLDVLREAKGNVYEEHKRFIHSFEPKWRTDECVMLLLGAITLFDPHRPNVVLGDDIRALQDSYYMLLRRYLESVYSSCEARSAYFKLVQRIDELHSLNDNHVRIYLDVNPKEVEPLLIEIFDLKNH